MGPRNPGPAGHRITSLLLAFNFPPHGGGIARMMGELALRYPRNALIVSTGACPQSIVSDSRFPQPIDRVGIRATRLRTVQGLALWTWRAGALAKQWRPSFAWCAELKPAAYPGWWLRARHGIPYGVIVHGTELLLLQEKITRSSFKRASGARILGNAAVIVANSNWTANLALDVVTALDAVVPVETVPLGTTPSHFRPGVDTSGVRAKY
ncbi:MAG TPA: glycosyltransferase, partial [Gemmatimonadales bacterium]|nr:glycosyltransferase [Gemmatimonadales bacterium]